MYDDAFFRLYYAHDDAAASLGHLPKEDTPSQNLEASSRAGGAACKKKMACRAMSHSIIAHDSITCCDAGKTGRQQASFFWAKRDISREFAGADMF